MKETIIDLKTRRSCRKYTDRQIDEETLNAILEAGTYAQVEWESRVRGS